MNTFKVGDKVKCINITYADSWCKGEMVVDRVYNPTLDYSSLHCTHPVRGTGAFKPEELVKVQTLEEQKQELQKQLEQINKLIADEKEKARLELGNKEVEIKLTLNELAWLVANVGTNGVVKTEAAMRTDAFLTEIPFTFTSPVVCGDGHYNLYVKLGSLLEHTVKHNM